MVESSIYYVVGLLLMLPCGVETIWSEKGGFNGLPETRKSMSTPLKFVKNSRSQEIEYIRYDLETVQSERE